MSRQFREDARFVLRRVWFAMVCGDLQPGHRPKRQTLELLEAASDTPAVGDYDQCINSAALLQAEGRYDEAAALFRQAEDLRPADPETPCKLGVVLHLAGDQGAAEVAYRRSLSLNAGFGKAHSNLGLLLEGQGRIDEAEAHFRASQSGTSPFEDGAVRLACLLARTRRIDEAISLSEQRIESGNAPRVLPEQLAFALAEAGETERAEHYYRLALSWHADSLVALNNYSVLLTKAGRFAEAETYSRRAVMVCPTDLAANQNLCGVLDKLGRTEEAESLARRLLMLHRDSAGVRVNLAHFASKRHAWDQVERLAREALALDPEEKGAHLNLGMACFSKGRLAEAEKAFRTELSNHPDLRICRFDLGCLQLLLGKFQEGWEGWEYRWDCGFGELKRGFVSPEWDGNPLRGKTLLLHFEQGLGDTLQFIRYAPLAAKMASSVVVVAQKPLQRLLQEIAGIRVVTRLPDRYDAYCYLASLPLKFGTMPETIPGMPQLSVPSSARARWSDLFSGREKPCADGAIPYKVGIVWAGNAKHPNDMNRSIAFEQLSPLLDVHGVQWVSLQKERRPDEIDEMVSECGWLDPLPDTDDFEDTAAIIEQLDLVICVDTAVAHLAGAMGKPVWLMLPANPDWRWMVTRPDDSPWYPSMKLFRQAELGEWEGVIARVRDALSRVVCGVPSQDHHDRLEEHDLQQQSHECDTNVQSDAATDERLDSSSAADSGESVEQEWVARLSEQIKDCPFWYHRIQLPGGIVTPGWMPLNPNAYDVPERLDGLRVLDIGAWDGFWSFEALRRGAREVVAIDDLSEALGVPADKPWRSWANFDVCREALGYDESVCQRKTMSVYELSEAAVGRFDIVFFFGTFNQLRYPLLALERIAEVCDRTLFVEAGILDDFSPYRGGLGRGYEGQQPIMEFYPNAQLANVKEVVWSPTLHALAAMVHETGFTEVEGWKLEEHPGCQTHCRGFVKGTK